MSETSGIDLSILDVQDVPNTFAPEPDSGENGTPKVENPYAAKAKEIISGSKKREEREQRKQQQQAKTPPKRKGMFVRPLTDMYSTIGTTVYMIEGAKNNGQSPCGTAILESAEKCAESLDELAYQNEAVRRVLNSLVQTSAIGAVVVAHAPIIMTVLMHHAPHMAGTIPAGMMQDVPDMPDPKDKNSA